ncbi:MAG: OmpA family protein, partial [Hyphomicrobiaceae bacterium]
TQSASDAPTTPPPNKPSPFDVISIQNDGVSVFAGLAKPNHKVVVRADGKTIGTTTTDGVGNWVLATETKITNPDAEFTIDVTRAAPTKTAADQPKTAALSKSPAPAGNTQSEGTVRKPSSKSVQAGPSAATASKSRPSKSAPETGKVATAKPAPTVTSVAKSKPRSTPKPVAQVTADMMARLENMVAQAKSSEVNPLPLRPEDKPYSVATAPTIGAAPQAVSPGTAPVMAEETASRVTEPATKPTSAPAAKPLPAARPTVVARSTAQPRTEETLTAAPKTATTIESVKGPVPVRGPEKSAATASQAQPKAVHHATLRPPVPPVPTTQAQSVEKVLAASIRVPIPIQFVYRQAEFTDAGRQAADLLVRFLKTKRIERATLTGHADERGTSRRNYRLSRQRLEAVNRYARAKGFTGELILVPRGETEPFTGVNRADYSKEDLHQLDRRVELHLQ